MGSQRAGHDWSDWACTHKAYKEEFQERKWGRLTGIRIYWNPYNHNSRQCEATASFWKRTDRDWCCAFKDWTQASLASQVRKLQSPWTPITEGPCACWVVLNKGPCIFLSFFFWCAPFLKPLLDLVQYYFCIMFWFFWLRGMWDLSSPTRDQTHTPCVRRWGLHHWTSREVRGNLNFHFALEPSNYVAGPELRRWWSWMIKMRESQEARRTDKKLIIVWGKANEDMKWWSFPNLSRYSKLGVIKKTWVIDPRIVFESLRSKLHRMILN